MLIKRHLLQSCYAADFVAYKFACAADIAAANAIYTAGGNFVAAAAVTMWRAPCTCKASAALNRWIAAAAAGNNLAQVSISRGASN